MTVQSIHIIDIQIFSVHEAFCFWTSDYMLPWMCNVFVALHLFEIVRDKYVSQHNELNVEERMAF
jgi:hypothetical protein